MQRAKQETATLETLGLLQRTLVYLKRLSVVPVTRVLIKEIEAHLADPCVLLVAGFQTGRICLFPSETAHF